MSRNENRSSIFEKMISELMNEQNGDQMLEDCMSFDVKLSERIPLRYRIIALGFVKHYTLEELNGKLQAEGCAQLYSRSLWEAGLIYAFLNQLSYHEWKKMQEDCIRIRKMQEENSGFFPNNGITFKEIKLYLEQNSDKEKQELATSHLTRLLEDKIQDVVREKKDFGSFLQKNIQSFSVVREKTRYYFCKYLYYDLQTRIENYLSACEAEVGIEESIAELAVFKNITPLRRNKMSTMQQKEWLENSRISCGEIFDAFNYFYFEYVSLDWMEILLEYYGNIEHMPVGQKRKLADALRHYDADYKGLSDEMVLDKRLKENHRELLENDEIYSLSGDKRGYQRNRAGENTIRKYIKGTLDIDRTTLICFLLFFGSEARLPQNMVITRERLSAILLECGFAALKDYDDFDYFVIQYLEASDPVDFLMETVTDYALQEENFYLYRMYQGAKSYDKEFQKMVGIDKKI